MTRRFYHVAPSRNGGWEVKRGGAERASGHFVRKVDAVKHARDLAEESGSDLIVHGKDGRIRESTARPLGYGSLKGQFVVRKGIDITKPIYEQALKIKKKRGRARTA
jgi:hypothetical protein